MKLGKYTIKNTGGYSVFEETEIKNKEGKTRVGEVNKASNSFLLWSLNYVSKNGNKAEKNEATRMIEALKVELSKNKVKGNYENMIEYRKIENSFFEGVRNV